MELAFVPSYAVLCVVQGLLVLAPWRPFRLARSSLLGLAVPLAMLGAGVGIVRAFSGGADALTTLAAIATPLLAALVARVRGWPIAWLAPVTAIGVYVAAWRGGDTLGTDLARLVLVASACLTLAALFSSLAPRRALAWGLVLLVALDMILVWGNRQIAPTTEALHAAAPPAVGLLGEQAEPLPSLQDVTLGSALMGWLDVLAPALLATLAATAPLRARVAVAATVTISALLWGLLLFLNVTSPIPATVPVLVGLVALVSLRRGSRAQPLGVGSATALPGVRPTRPP